MAKLTKTSPEWQSKPSTDSTQSKTRAEQNGMIACLVLHAAEAWRRKAVEYQESEDGAVELLERHEGLGANTCYQLLLAAQV